jgi:sigma-B regulation protein RsbU (phosphoserine phosphatase)
MKINSKLFKVLFKAFLALVISIGLALSLLMIGANYKVTNTINDFQKVIVDKDSQLINNNNNNNISLLVNQTRKNVNSFVSRYINQLKSYSSQIEEAYYDNVTYKKYNYSSLTSSYFSFPPKTDLAKESKYLKNFNFLPKLLNSFEDGLPKDTVIQTYTILESNGFSVTSLKQKTFPYDFRTANYYKQVKYTKKCYIGNPYKDVDLEIDMLTYACPIYYNSKFFGILATDLNYKGTAKQMFSESSEIKEIVFYNPDITMSSEHYAVFDNPSTSSLLVKHSIDIYSDTKSLYDSNELQFTKQYDDCSFVFMKEDDWTWPLLLILKFDNNIQTINELNQVTVSKFGEIGQMATTTQLIVLALFVLISILVFAYIRRKSKKAISTITEPIVTLTEKVKEIGLGHLSKDFPKSTSDDEIGEIDNEVSKMAVDLKRLIDEELLATKTTAELDIAKSIQLNLLPTFEAPLAKSTDFQIDARSLPAREVGGDFYDFYMIDKSHLLFLIADVSDKGVGAAIYMAIYQTVLRNCAKASGSPSEILVLANDIISEKNKSMMFCTCLLGILNTNTGEVQYSNAGHNPPIIMSKNSAKVVDLIPNVPLGLFGNIEYETCTLQLQPNEQLFFYTDGVPDAINTSDERFGEENTLKFAKRVKGGTVSISNSILFDDLRQFSKGAEPADDITTLFLEYKPNYFTTKIDLTKNKPPYDFLTSEITDNLKIEGDKVNQVRLVLEELITNVYNYSEANLLIVTYMKENDNYKFAIADNGIEFNPLSIETGAENPETIDDAKIGGLGIFLTKELVKNIEYERVYGYNKVSVFI